MSVLISFLGGSLFRMLWGEISHFITNWQDNKQQLAMMEMQETINAAQHARNLEALKLQSDLGIKEIEAKSNADQLLEELKAWTAAVTDVGKSTGIKWLDAWNGAIRPSVATWSIAMMTMDFMGFYKMSDGMWDVASAALGIYLADRTLFKRGK